MNLSVVQAGVVQAVAVGCDREDDGYGEAGPCLLLDRVPRPPRQRGGVPAHAQCHHQVQPVNRKR